MNKLFYTKHPTPLGDVTLISNRASLTMCLFPHEQLSSADISEEKENMPVFVTAKKYLDAYFAGETNLILPPLLPMASEYTKLVLNEAMKIPYGTAISYQELARRINKPKHARSVGNALGKNPLPIFIPCHRIIKSDNSLGGYTGGVNYKIKLLALEAKHKM